LVRHDPGDLMEVREVVSGPGSQQLRHRDWPQRRMPSTKFKFCLAQIHRLQVGEIGGAYLQELH
jgi:hypothetical protein